MADVIVRVKVAPAREHEADPAMTASSLGNPGMEDVNALCARRARASSHVIRGKDTQVHMLHVHGGKTVRMLPCYAVGVSK